MRTDFCHNKHKRKYIRTLWRRNGCLKFKVFASTDLFVSQWQPKGLPFNDNLRNRAHPDCGNWNVGCRAIDYFYPRERCLGLHCRFLGKQYIRRNDKGW